MLSDERQLGYALEAFAQAHRLGVGWATSKLLCFKEAGVTSMNDLRIGCQDRTINLDLELFGIPSEEQISDSLLQKIQVFLPGPRGFRCFRLAQVAAQKIAKGAGETEYVHRPESGKIGEEQWHTPIGEQWILNVDCAGFVRNCLKHVTKDPFVIALSDRDFMRAKDFYTFFNSIPYSVMDPEPIPESDKRMKWRVVKDLRMVIPGDVICYRPRGNAAGGAAFTINDRKDLSHLLKAVRTAQIWSKGEGDWGNMVTHNVAKDPTVRPWMTAVKAKLAKIGITSAKELYLNLNSVNDKLREANLSPFYSDTLDLMRECAETTAQNTGHIVFAAGPAVDMGDNSFRIRVVHSTKYGKKDENGVVTTGVQEYFKRFQMIELPDGSVKWTREMKQAKPMIDPSEIDDEDNPLDDMEEDEVEETEPVDEEEVAGDDVDGQAEVEVIAARMCF